MALSRASSRPSVISPLLPPRMGMVAACGMVLTWLLLSTAGWPASPGPARTPARKSTPVQKAVAPPRTPTRAPNLRSLLTLVDGVGRARIHFTDLVDTSPLQKGAQPTLASLYLSLPGGLLKGSLETGEWPILRGWRGDGQADVTQDSIRARSQFRATVPLEGTTLDATFTQKRKAGTLDLGGRLRLDVPTQVRFLSLVRLAVRGSSRGTWRQGDNNLQVSVAMKPGSLDRRIPRRVELRLAHTDAGLTFRATVVASRGSWPGDAIKDATNDPARLESVVLEQVQGLKISLDGFHVEKVRAGGDLVGMTVSGTATNVGTAARDQLVSLLAFLDPGKKCLPAMTAACDDILKLRVDRLEVSLTRTEDEMEFGMQSRLSHTDRFVCGYLSAYAEFMEMIRSLSRGRTLMDRLSDFRLLAVIQQFRRIVPAMEKASTGRDAGTSAFSLALTNADGHLRATGDLALQADMAGFLRILQDLGMPVISHEDLQVRARTEGREILVDARVDQGGPWLAAVRQPYLDTLRQVERWSDVAAPLAAMELRAGRFRWQVGEGRLTAQGYVRTSDLSALTQAVAGHLPQVPGGRVMAADMSWIHRGGRKAIHAMDLYMEDMTPENIQALADNVKRLLRAGTSQVRKATSPADLAPPPATVPFIPASAVP